jgi:hypothetical protein
MGETLSWCIKFQNSELVFMLLDPKIVTEIAVIFVLGWKFLNQTQILNFFSRNLFLRMENFKISSIFLVPGP